MSEKSIRKNNILRRIAATLIAVFWLTFVAALAFFVAEKRLYPLLYEQEVAEVSERYGIEPAVILAIVKTESGFDRAAVSAKGAIGLMQLKSDTYEVDIAANLGLAEGAEALFDAEFNVMCGAYYLHWLDWRVDGITTIAAAYHDGIGTVRGWLSDTDKFPDGKLTYDDIPSEIVKHYLDKIFAFYEKSVLLDGKDETYPFDK